MRRISLTPRRLILAITAAFVASLAVTAAGAHAVVVNVAHIRQPAPLYDQGPTAGLAMVPGTSTEALKSTGAQVVATPGGSCSIDAPLQSLLTFPSQGLLCGNGGPVIHNNETFTLVWDPPPHSDYAAPYVEQFLRDVADGSGTLTSPYAVTGEYAGPDQTTGAPGPAANSSKHGGDFDDRTGYGANGCQPSGIHHYYLETKGVYTDVNNDVCLTDAQVKSEVAAQIQAQGLNKPTAIQPGFTPIITLLLPPGVVTCFDATNKLCSANSDPSVAVAQFCSYHAQLAVGGKVWDYVVQPWTAQTKCDDDPTDQPQFPSPVVDPVLLSQAMGSRLVSPLSQAVIATIVNPDLNGWFNVNTGAEINDNGCEPLSNNLDQVTVGPNQYWLQREFNNAGAVVNNPFSQACTRNVVLQPSFVLPSAVNAGDVVEFDGSKSVSTLLIPDGNYEWDFGDGTAHAYGPSAVHSYAHGGTYGVTLKVTDRGGDSVSLPQTIQVLGSNGQPVSAPPASGGPSGSSPALSVHLQLLPQSLKSVLRHGIAVRVASNAAANGIATVSISRAAARRAHIKVGRSPIVRIGIGTLASVTNGTVDLHLHLSPSVARKLAHVGHVTMTIRLALVDAGNQRVAIDAAGRY
jgi:hypothetical protein